MPIVKEKNHQGNLLPQNIEAEEAVLGAMENNPVFSPASFRRVLHGLKHSCEK